MNADLFSKLYKKLQEEEPKTSQSKDGAYEWSDHAINQAMRMYRTNDRNAAIQQLEKSVASRTNFEKKSETDIRASIEANAAPLSTKNDGSWADNQARAANARKAGANVGGLDNSLMGGGVATNRDTQAYEDHIAAGGNVDSFNAEMKAKHDKALIASTATAALIVGGVALGGAGLLPKALKIFGKWGIQLGAEAVKGLLNELGQLFNTEIESSPDSPEKKMDSLLQYDIKNLIQKCRTKQDTYSQSIVNSLSTLSKPKNNQIQEGFGSTALSVGKAALGGVGKAASGAMNMVNNYLGNDNTANTQKVDPLRMQQSKETTEIQTEINSLYQKTQIIGSEYAKQIEIALKPLLQGAKQ